MIVCIDIGGGTTRIGFSENKKTFKNIVKFSTEDNFEQEIEKIVEEIKKETQGPHSVVIAAAGLVDRENGMIISWGQKKSWWGKNIFKPFSKIFPKAKLLIENDANLAALGEAVFGAGKNNLCVGYITLSSGVGGGLVINKEILSHSYGFEPGHQIVNYSEEKEWSCGQKGCFESYASGKAFEQIFNQPAENCSDKVIWEKYGRIIAPGVANLIVFWSPEVLVIGGGIANRFESFIEPLEKELTRILPMYKKLPKIVKGELDEAGLYGGLSVA
jgi:predicted NBD/HSP70 family sugar kinase